MKKTEEKRLDLLSDINLTLETVISKDEREALELAQDQLEKEMYLPKIVAQLRDTLTPLAISNNLSRPVSKIYLKIINHDYMDKGLDIGIIQTNFASFN